MAQLHQNFINGQWQDSSCGQEYEQRNPADLTEITGIWPKSSVADVASAIEAAAAAFASWSRLTVYQRAEYFAKVLQVMKSRVEQIAAVITAENGKTLKESKGEIESAIKEMEFQIGEGLRMAGEVMPSGQNGVMAYSMRRPLGVVAVISPWNFPFNVPCRKITPALMTGNTCIFKPANLTPGIGAEFVKLFDEAGLPPGVLNFITGSGAVIGDAIVGNPLIKAVTFTGSTEVGRSIHQKAAANFTRTQLEMGGKNPLVVLADADLQAAASSAALAAYACAGQWCTSTSRVVVEEKLHDDFVKLLLEKVKKIKVGKGTDSSTTMGPVCGKSQLEGILGGIEKGKAEGAKLIIGGNQIKTKDLTDGCFIEPTIFTEVTPDMFIAQEEIFGPVLSIIKAKDFEDAVKIANNVKFGLSSSIYTNDLQKALTFVERTDVGLTHVNIPTAVKEAQLSFGGVKLSGCGIPEAGHTGVEFFTEHKVAYIKYR
ncbi:MAG: Aldehyde Dehydrogenase [Parcubacteria group bacterium GW2011_GWF2_45_11]|nr:MAG: Aldehyde Dehydrogenase [Parcubacteria group bacterium GW2011_GWF2_45_11]